MFPKFDIDAEYCYEKLVFLVGNTPNDEFLQAFKAINDAKKIHRFYVAVSSASVTVTTTC